MPPLGKRFLDVYRGECSPALSLTGAGCFAVCDEGERPFMGHLRARAPVGVRLVWVCLPRGGGGPVAQSGAVLLESWCGVRGGPC